MGGEEMRDPQVADLSRPAKQPHPRVGRPRRADEVAGGAGGAGEVARDENGQQKRQTKGDAAGELEVSLLRPAQDRHAIDDRGGCQCDGEDPHQAVNCRHDRSADVEVRRCAVHRGAPDPDDLGEDREDHDGNVKPVAGLRGKPFGKEPREPCEAQEMERQRQLELQRLDPDVLVLEQPRIQRHGRERRHCQKYEQDACPGQQGHVRKGPAQAQ